MEGTKRRIGVIGAGICPPEIADIACHVGELIASRGGILYCGGLGGVMEAAARGASEAGGLTVGILPGSKASDANAFITVPVVTGMGHARNVILVRSSEAIIALPGSHGTLSEIALALKMWKPVVGLGAWGDLPGVHVAKDPEDAVEQAFSFVDRP